MENIPQTPAPLPQPEQQPKRKISNKIWAIIILAIIAGVLSWVYIQRQPKVDLSPIVMNHKEKQPELKTYTNTEYGFEFSYPISYSLEEQQNSYTIKVPNSEATFDISFKLNPKNISLSDDLKTSEDENYSIKIFSQTEDMVTVNEAIDAKIGVEGCGNLRMVKIKATNGIISYSYCKDNLDSVFNNDEKAFNDYLKSGDLIFSTFKFTIPKTSEWKTYKNEEFGFEFKYPGFDNIIEEERMKNGGIDVWGNNFVFSVTPNKNKETLRQLFDREVDYKGLLIEGGTFTFEKKYGVDAAIMTGAIPVEYTDYAGPISTSFLGISPSGDIIMRLSIGGENRNLGEHGYTGEGAFGRLQDEILSTLKFTK